MDWSRYFGKKVVIDSIHGHWLGCDTVKGYADYNREFLELENGSAIRCDQIGKVRVLGEYELREYP